MRSDRVIGGEATASTPQALAPLAGHPKFPLVDAMRAFAASLVIAYHIAYISGALSYGWASKLTSHLNVGVAVFFAISGFLLYRPFVAARFGAPARAIRAYSRNRILRIVPGYWVALTVAAIYPGLTGVFSGDWSWYYGFAQVYSAKRQLLGLPVAWTLGVEISFYALLPLYALAMRRLIAERVRWAALELCALGALCLLTTVLQASAPFVHLSTIVATFDWFAVGMALAVLSVHGSGTILRVLADRPAALWCAAIGVYLALCQWFQSLYAALNLGTWGVQELINVFYATIAGLVLLPAVLTSAKPRIPHRILRAPVLAWLGLISYGLYLYHLPILVGVEKLHLQDLVPGETVLSYSLVGLPTTVALAATSYYLIERPALRLKRRSQSTSRALDG